jgi:predicted nuclease with TOPRIM domain
MEGDRLYQRLESLERTQERHSALLQELQRRVDGIEEMREDVRRIEKALARMEERLEAVLSKTNTWQTLVWAVLLLLLSGVVAAGFELLRR